MDLNVRLLREFSGLNQTEFWDRVGVTQSGGARYELGERQLRKPLLHLLRLVYIEKVDIERIRREDVELVSYLKSEQPALYKKLRRDAAAFRRKKQA